MIAFAAELAGNAWKAESCSWNPSPPSFSCSYRITMFVHLIEMLHLSGRRAALRFVAGIVELITLIQVSCLLQGSSQLHALVLC